MSIQLALWLCTMLFFVAFFTYGYVLWRRARLRRSREAQPGPQQQEPEIR